MDQSLTVSGDSTVTMDGGIAALSGAAALNLSDSLGITEPESAAFSAGDKTIIDQSSQKAKHAVIGKNAAETLLLGDADGDGVISIIDATTIQRYLVSLNVPSTQNVERCGDVTGDGLDILDATAIQRFLADLTVVYAIGKPIE